MTALPIQTTIAHSASLKQPKLTAADIADIVPLLRAKTVFSFGSGVAEGTREWKDILGGKGANLAEMTNLGLPVPPGFTIACSACDHYLETGEIPGDLREEVTLAIQRLEDASGRVFGDGDNPLLVSVRSGARVSMPGMMETILNLGLNDVTVEGLMEQSGSAQFAYDSYRRFLQMYGSIVLGVQMAGFEALLADTRSTYLVSSDAEIPSEGMRALIPAYKALIKSESGKEVPMDPAQQLWGAIEAVWNSWTLKKAIDYRRANRIPDAPATAVNIVAMVFGNLGGDSGTGVAFTRNPSTGERQLYGEFLVNAQGEDVVAGIRTPLPISEMASRLPAAHEELLRVQELLETHYRDMQDLEFTVERGKLHMLQTRNGKRTVAAAARIALDMVNEKLITKSEALQRISADQLDQLLHPVINEAAAGRALCTGLPASPGAASGKAVFDSDTAERCAAKGERVILVREETSPEDFHGIVAAQAVLTARGGMTSHAAVVARGMGKCAVVGCHEMTVDSAKKCCTIGRIVVEEGQWITLDGASGRVFASELRTKPSEVVRVLEGTLSAEDVPGFEPYRALLEWSDSTRQLKVRANADTPADARRARQFGAEGIGLCRTEHMFFEGDRITPMREMIVATDEAGRRAALAKLLPMQRDDFRQIFEAMDGLPVTIRLLDPPLHEFLPHTGDECESLSDHLGVPPHVLTRTVESLREANPMLGHRGCRLGITYPEITEMQGRAIFEAAKLARDNGVDVQPEIMIPLIATVKEFEHQREIIDAQAAAVFGDDLDSFPYLVGTMIELPRAALIAGQIARVADFFSFGTNDLTQTTLGLSRDDAGRFLPYYVEKGILPDDPFQVIDEQGVGKLVTLAVDGGRTTDPSLKMGICGEHGGDPRSVLFFHRVGLDYVSCSPYRVPVARLAAAQAVLQDDQ